MVQLAEGPPGVWRPLEWGSPMSSPAEKIVTACPECRKRYRAKQGRKVTCVACGARFTAQPKSASQGLTFTVQEAEALWAGTVAADQDPALSIKGLKTIVPPRGRPREGRVVNADEGGGDYVLGEQIGLGGMGVVYSARQGSIDREVALKLIRGERAEDPAARQKFLSEAAITGELDHPGIVPVYELGRTQDGALFYAMKRVQGTSWDRVLASKTQSENLAVLVRVAEAVAFAHDHGVVHRDLKPENVMLGDYGEVLLLDWGLALQAGAGEETELAGTPAYMAPEMARGDAVGTWSDVYLLGAILFEVVSGKRPHTGKNVYACLAAAANNQIQVVPHQGELMTIARTAMSSEPADRHPDVKALLAAIREHERHAESMSLAARAGDDLRAGQVEGNYELLARARFGFREALRLWPEHEAARAGLARTRLVYGRFAFEKGDLDLAASLLEPGEGASEEAGELSRQVGKAVGERDARRRRARALTLASAAMGAVVLVVLTGAFFWTRVKEGEAVAEARRAKLAEATATKERNAAREAEEQAKQQEDRANAAAARASREAKRATREAERATREAERAKREEALARAAEAKARAALAGERTALAKARQAERSRTRAEQRLVQALVDNYPSVIQRISADLDEDKVKAALRDLGSLSEPYRGWEWGRLRLLCQPSYRVLKGHGQSYVSGVAFTPGGQRVVTCGRNGTAVVWDRRSGKRLQTLRPKLSMLHGLALHPTRPWVALGGILGVEVWDVSSGKRVRAVKIPQKYLPVYALAYARDGETLAVGGTRGSTVWNTRTGRMRRLYKTKQLAQAVAITPDGRWLTQPVNGMPTLHNVATGRAVEFPARPGRGEAINAVAISRDGKLLLTGGSSERARLWDLTKRRFLGRVANHQEPVTALAFSPDGLRVLSGDRGGTVRLTWRRGGRAPIEPFEHPGKVTALAFAPNGYEIATAGGVEARVWPIHGRQWVLPPPGKGVRSAALSADGRQVLIGDADGTAALVDLESGRTVTLKGHGDGAITCVALAPGGKQVVTGSSDQTAIVWDAQTGQQLMRFKGHVRALTHVGFGADDGRLITIANGGSLRRWDLESGDEVFSERKKLSPVGIVMGVARKPFRVVVRHGNPPRATEEQFEVVGGAKHAVPLPREHRPAMGPVAGALSPDGALLATGGAAYLLQLLDLSTGKLRWRIEHPKTPRGVMGYRRGLSAIVFSPDGNRIVTGDAQGAVTVWDVRTRKRLLELTKLGQQILSLRFSADGRTLVAATRGRIHVWPSAPWNKTR